MPLNKAKSLSHTSGAHDENREEGRRDSLGASVALSSSEIVDRFGSANAEFIKGYRGIDNETGQQFAKGLSDIAKHKVNANPQEAAKNIKQQAGYAAEVTATSRDNAEAIIQRSDVRVMRSDDLPQYGKNHTVVDRVQVLNGKIIEGSQAQMKFVGNRDQLLERIAREDGKFARYRGVKLELPSEQFEGAKEFCHEKADALRKQAEQVAQHGKPEVAAKLRREADNYNQLGDNVRDTGLTTEDAIFYREHPEIASALDIAGTSHRAGLEGAKCGVCIGACITLLQNSFAVAQGDKELEDAAIDLIVGTAKAGGIGYGTALVGAATKGVMQQSSREGIRVLSRTSAPTLVVNVCLSLGSSVKRYVMGEISEAQLLGEVGEKGSGMLSSCMMAALGQVAMPVPFVGAAIGGMIGYTLSSLFYRSALDAAVGAEASREQLERMRAIQTAARARIAQQQAVMVAFTRSEIPQLDHETKRFFSITDSAGLRDADTFAAAVNNYASLLGMQLQFDSMSDFDDFMGSDQALRL